MELMSKYAQQRRLGMQPVRLHPCPAAHQGYFFLRYMYTLRSSINLWHKKLRDRRYPPTASGFGDCFSHFLGPFENFWMCML